MVALGAAIMAKGAYRPRARPGQQRYQAAEDRRPGATRG